jgi:NAD(P)-dependent dehydrogenase (short-subunit alcohol dehydrogenase family)
MMNPLDLTGKTIMITGASKGIGEATAIYLSRLGATIVAVARDQERLQQTVSQLEGVGHFAYSFDLTEVEQIPAWLKTTAQTSGPLFGLVHSAGIVLNRPLKVLSYKDLAATERINLEAGVFLAKGFRQKGVCEETGSSIVFLSSVAALKGQPALSAYAATKGALISLTRTLAVELARDKVRVNCLCPGLVQTRMAADLFATVPPESVEKIHNAHPLGLGMPDDVAYATAFLLAPAARWITGSVLVLDGGYCA